MSLQSVGVDRQVLKWNGRILSLAVAARTAFGTRLSAFAAADAARSSRPVEEADDADMGGSPWLLGPHLRWQERQVNVYHAALTLSPDDRMRGDARRSFGAICFRSNLSPCIAVRDADQPIRCPVAAAGTDQTLGTAFSFRSPSDTALRCDCVTSGTKA